MDRSRACNGRDPAGYGRSRLYRRSRVCWREARVLRSRSITIIGVCAAAEASASMRLELGSSDSRSRCHLSRIASVVQPAAFCFPVGEQLADVLRMVLELLEGSQDLICVARRDRVPPFLDLLEVAGLGSDDRNDTRRPGIASLVAGLRMYLSSVSNSGWKRLTHSATSTSR
jgi:hypothetical protein